ncbi:MAG: 4-(cytidine 5'-diphospho)-2-C-methyl-D-erythritol kinase [Mariprofundaceae bacterium]|nr:4-(cytidine 5'-diphospho)-2-C-methyl-D-erythritol kinase [Mariprofundaceae bacterium]
MIEVPAPAKINLHLRITGITADDYHLLDTSFVYTDACDVLHIDTSESLEISCSDPSLNGADNLVFHVLDALRRKYRIHQGLRVHVEKKLPMQAGLGGGSSDAATALIAANHLWKLGLNSRQLIAFATPFGADIPCFLFGQASLASGIGEQLSPLDISTIIAPKRQHIVLAHPGVGLSTAAVFQRFDSEFTANNNAKSSQLTPSGTKATIRASLTGDSGGLLADEHKTAPESAIPIEFSLGENALESVSCAMCPQLARLLACLRREQAKSWMSGSGTACISLCENAESGTQIADRLRAEDTAVWHHVGSLLPRHPLHNSGIEPHDWGVAKR